jgi:hypothetical protein
VDWVNLDHDMYEWCALVNTVMNLTFPAGWGNSSLFSRLLTPIIGLHFIELVSFFCQM